MIPTTQPYDKRSIGPQDIYQFAPTQGKRATEWTKTAGGGGDLTEFPFQIQAGTALVNIRYGTISSILPTDVGTDVDVSGTDGDWTFWIETTINDAGVVTAAALGYGTSGMPTDDSDTAYFLIGVVTVASAVITTVNQNAMFSMGFVACGRDVADPATTPGVYHFFVGQSSNAAPPPTPPGP